MERHLMFRRCDPVRDPELYALYLQEHPYCQVCGRPDALSRHHLIGGSSRSDERTNLLVACVVLCHPLMEGHRVVVRGVRYDQLSLGCQLAIKLLRTPGEYDAARLEELRGQALPDHEPVPRWVVESFRKYRPWECAS